MKWENIIGDTENQNYIDENTLSCRYLLEKIEKKELTFAEKKAKGVYSTRGSVRVSGGLLPHHSSMGMIDFYYDGKKAPSLTGSRGRISIYKTDGNLQIFYKNPDDVKDKEFLGLIVDMYKI